MNEKTFGQIPAKNRPESGDSFILNSETAVSAANIQSWVKETTLMEISANLKSADNDWIRLFRFRSSGMPVLAVLMITTQYINKAPVPLVCIVTGYGEQAQTLSCQRLSSNNIGTGSSSRPSFKGARFVKENGNIYFEVQIDTGDTWLYYSLPGANNIVMETPSISTATEVIKTIDLTTTQNISNMQNIENQPSIIEGGGGVE